MQVGFGRVYAGSVWLLATLAFASCSSSSSSDSTAGSGVDAGLANDDAGVTPADGGSSGDDAAKGDAATEPEDPTGTPPGPSENESEPNGGANDDAGVPQTNTMTIPGTMSGAIDPADDADIFKLDFAPGDLWFFRIAADTGAPYVPHLTVFDIAPSNLNPTRLVKAASASVDAPLPCFVLRPGTFVAAVRDARNVPSASSAHAGGPTDKYVLKAWKTTPVPTAVSLPSSVSGALKSFSALAFYSFTTTKNTNVEIVLKAARKAKPSALDSRMTLFHAASKTAILTNDNAGGTTTDSEIRGPMPMDGEYWVIVENEAAMVYDPASVPDLSYTIDFNLK